MLSLFLLVFLTRKALFVRRSLNSTKRFLLAATKGLLVERTRVTSFMLGLTTTRTHRDDEYHVNLLF